MDYEKEYKEALERARMINDEQRAQPFNIMTKVFHELQESEDERIRKEIISLVQYTKGRRIGYEPRISQDNMIAWLEKQGEPNPYSGTSFKYNGHTWGMCARDNGVEILVDGEIKERVFLDNKPHDARENLTLDGDLMEADCMVVEQNPSWSAYRIGFADGEAHAKEEMTTVWSEEDEACTVILNGLCDLAIAEYDEDSTESPMKAQFIKAKNWLKSLKERVGCEVNCTTK